jgi:hypothetical protein
MKTSRRPPTASITAGSFEIVEATLSTGGPVIRDHDAVGAGIERRPCIVGLKYALDDQLALPESAQPAMSARSRPVVAVDPALTARCWLDGA